jgi:DNA-binding transcriptional MerR regulator
MRMTSRPRPGERRILGVAEVAALFEVDPRTVARWDKKGKLPTSFRTPGRHRRWYEDEIMAQLDAARSRKAMNG